MGKCCSRRENHIIKNLKSRQLSSFELETQNQQNKINCDLKFKRMTITKKYEDLSENEEYRNSFILINLTVCE